MTEQPLENGFVIRLSDEQWDEFVAMLDAPSDTAKLTKLMKQQAPWDKETK